MNQRASIRRGRQLRLPRVEQLLPLACLAAAALLFASELMTTFEFIPPGREAVAEQTAADRHGYALGVIATFTFVATLVAVFVASKPAALGVGIAGVIALLVFLVIDLPDAGAVGTLEDSRQSFFDAEAVPQAGFWLGLAGALSLAVSGIALATLSSRQLAALRPRRSPAARPDGTAEHEERPAVAPASSNPDGLNTEEPIPLRRGGAEDQAGRPRQADRRRERT